MPKKEYLVRWCLCLIVILILFRAASGNLIPYDLTECVEKGECGIVGVGSYKLEDGPSSFHEGYVVEIKNGLEYDVTYYWNNLVVNPAYDGKDAELGDNATVLDGDTYHPVLVKANSVRYVDTGIPGTQIVRLYVKSMHSNEQDGVGDGTARKMVGVMESIDSVVARKEKKCGGGRRQPLCSMLMRICLGFHYGGGMSSMHSATETDREDQNFQKKRCDEYYEGCKGFQKNTEGDTCIQSCIYEHFSQFLSEKARNEGDEFEFDPALAVNCIAANEDHRKKIEGDPKLKKEWIKITQSWSAGDADERKIVDDKSLETYASIRDQLKFAKTIGRKGGAKFAPDGSIEAESWDDGTSCDGASNAVAALSIILAIVLLLMLVCLFMACKRGKIDVPGWWSNWWYGFEPTNSGNNRVGSDKKDGGVKNIYV